MGTASGDRKSFLPSVGWDVGSWDAQNRGAPWEETFEKGSSQIVRKVGALGDLQSKAAVPLEYLGLRERSTMQHQDH